jgi:hypothetical protein
MAKKPTGLNLVLWTTDERHIKKTTNVEFVGILSMNLLRHNVVLQSFKRRPLKDSCRSYTRIICCRFVLCLGTDFFKLTKASSLHM